jgi:hypothetical protein
MQDAAGAAISQPGQTPSAPKVLSRKSAKPKASADQVGQIIALHKQGYTNKQIAGQFGINGQSVNGVIASAKRQGLLPPSAPAVNGAVAIAMANGLIQEPQANIQDELPPQLELPVAPLVRNQVQPPMNNGIHPQPAPQSSSATQDDFSGGRPVVGASGGFTGANQAAKYAVERIAPPDGLLGTHYGSFTIEELGQNYGEGTYKVTKHDPTQKFAVEYVQKIGPSYGQPRSPNHPSQRPQMMGQRPFFQRNWGAQPAQEQEEGQERPIFRPSFHRPVENTQAVAALEIARQQQAGNTSAMETALAMMGTMHQQSLQQIESARKGGPDNMMTNFLRDQQEVTNRRWEEERKVQDQRRKDDEEKYQRRQDEEQRRWERDQQAERDRHSRELERIGRETESREKQLRFDAEEREKRSAEERRFLLDLEEKKIQLVRQEAEASQKRLEAELTRSREEMKEMADRTNRTITENQEATTRHIEESQKQIQEQLDREREQLEREHKLKEKGLDTRRELEGKYLDLQKANMENSGGDQIFNTINTVIKEVSKGLEKVVDLKKLESMTPEAQIAHVARGAQAPAEAPVQQQRPQAQPQPQVQAQPQPVQEAPVQETAVPVVQEQPAESPGEAVVANRMEVLIRENLQKPFFQDVLKEWALHVESAAEDKAVDATTFANLYLEMMRDPRNDEARQGCAAFATFMKPRNWQKMLAVLRGALDPVTIAAFERPEAEEFYKQFKAMVLEQITEYWEQFLASRQQRNGGAQPGAPAAPAPVEPGSAPMAQNAAPSGQTP